MNDQELQEILQNLPPLKAPKSIKKNIFTALDEVPFAEKEEQSKPFLNSSYLIGAIGILIVFGFTPLLSVLEQNANFDKFIPTLNTPLFHLFLSLMFLIFAIERLITIRFLSH